MTCEFESYVVCSDFGFGKGVVKCKTHGEAMPEGTGAIFHAGLRCWTGVAEELDDLQKRIAELEKAAKAAVPQKPKRIYDVLISPGEFHTDAVMGVTCMWGSLSFRIPGALADQKKPLLLTLSQPE